MPHNHGQACELCTVTVIKGTIWKVLLRGFINEITICDDCRAAVLAAYRVSLDGTEVNHG